ncbi:MAG: hypothetical protein GX547_06095 [Phycisphaerae bacterium]|nr:hypothetical protein [Phycisphaerae bacterium]
MEALRDILAIGRATSAHSAIGQLTRYAIDGFAIWIVEDITPVLQVDNAGATPQGDARPCRRQQVNDLIKDLLASDFEQDWIQSMWFDRMLLIDGALWLAEGKTLGTPPIATAGPFAPWNQRVAVWAVKPAWLLDSKLFADHIDRFSESALHTWPSADADLLLLGGADSLTCRMAHYPRSILGSRYDMLQDVVLHGLARRRMAATALAIRLYELDHGRRPERLAELVPDYLPSVPGDPFAADDRPIGYAPHGPRPVLYSVNIDGIDEGGRYVLNSAGRVERDGADFPFFLNGDRPGHRPMASSQPSRGVSPP